MLPWTRSSRPTLFQPPVRNSPKTQVAARSASILTQDLSSEDSTDLFSSNGFGTFPGTALRGQRVEMQRFSPNLAILTLFYLI